MDYNTKTFYHICQVLELYTTMWNWYYVYEMVIYNVTGTAP